MGAEAHQLQGRGIRLSVNQHEVGPEVAIPVILPVAGQRVIAIPVWQPGIGCKQ
jgi:hypothetical protein